MIRPRRVSRGDPVLAEHHNELVDAILERTPPVSVPGGRITTTPQGWALAVSPGKGGKSVAAVSHPFQVLQRPKPNVPNVWQCGVVYESSLYLSLRPNHKQVITGLLSEDQTTGWFDIISADAIWLGIVFDGSGTPVSVGIDSWGQGDSFEIDENAWSGNDGYCEDDGDAEAPVHQTSRKLIAYTMAGETGQPPVLTQVMFRDQVLRNVCIDGRPARYPFDHEGGYPL